jgi:hypothetical protein
MGKGEQPEIVVPLLADKEGAPIDELDDHILLLEAVRHRLEVEWAESLGVFEDRDGHEVHGYPSMVAYLKHRARIAASRAKRYVLLARAARRFQATLASWKHRQISSDQAEMLFRVSEQLPDKYPDAEAVLLEIVGDTPEETRQILDYWRHSVDKAGVVIENELQLQRRRFDYTRKANGMIEGDFALTETAGETFIVAIDALMPPPSDGDTRTPSQRRADALEDLSRSFLEGSETPDVGGEKPHFNIHVDLEALQGSPGGLHETEDGHVLNVETIRQLACDASVSRIVFGPKSELLDVGRKTRVIPVGLRRAVIARDRYCVRKGCKRKPRWCDIHHIISWADGGETSLENLCLLCRYHHTLIHRQQAEDLDNREPPVPAERRRPI